MTLTLDMLIIQIPSAQTHMHLTITTEIKDFMCAAISLQILTMITYSLKDGPLYMPPIQ